MARPERFELAALPAAFMSLAAGSDLRPKSLLWPSPAAVRRSGSRLASHLPLVSVLKNNHSKANHKEEHRQQRNLREEGPAEQQHRHQPYLSNPVRHRETLRFEHQALIARPPAIIDRALPGSATAEVELP
jgi:hypothetical protein